jgi:hypothetical protein
MSATALSVTPLSRNGITDTLSAANTDGHTIVNTADNMWIEVLNGSGGSINVTIETIQTIDGLAVADRVVAVGAGVRKKIGPFPRTNYGSTVTVTFSDVTTVTIGAFSLA